jgi:hypothetical protein
MPGGPTAVPMMKDIITVAATHVVARLSMKEARGVFHAAIIVAVEIFKSSLLM